jgi:hypothetical protein
MEKKRNPEDILDEIESAPADDAAEQVLAMSAEERMRELERAGVSEREIGAAVDAIHARMQAGGAGQDAAPRAGHVLTRRRARRTWLTAAAAVAAAASLVAITEGAAIVAWVRGPEKIGPDSVHPAPPEPSPHEIAERKRDDAEKALGAELYGKCIQLLDEAREIDPAGDDEPRVRLLRATVKERTTVRPEKEKP